MLTHKEINIISGIIGLAMLLISAMLISIKLFFLLLGAYLVYKAESNRGIN